MHFMKPAQPGCYRYSPVVRGGGVDVVAGHARSNTPRTDGKVLQHEVIGLELDMHIHFKSHRQRLSRAEVA